MNNALYGAIIMANSSIARARKYAAPHTPQPGYWPVGSTIATPFGRVVISSADGNTAYFKHNGKIHGVFVREGVAVLCVPSQGLASGLHGEPIKRRPKGFVFPKSTIKRWTVMARFFFRNLTR